MGFIRVRNRIILRVSISAKRLVFTILRSKCSCSCSWIDSKIWNSRISNYEMYFHNAVLSSSLFQFPISSSHYNFLVCWKFMVLVFLSGRLLTIAHDADARVIGFAPLILKGCRRGEPGENPVWLETGKISNRGIFLFEGGGIPHNCVLLKKQPGENPVWYFNIILCRFR